MRNLFTIFVFIFLIGVFSSAKAQVSMTSSVVETNEPNIRLDMPIFSNGLSGTVKNFEGKKLENIKVERLDENWKNVVETVFTDKKGRFKFTKVPIGNYNLRFNWLIITTPSFLEVTIAVKKIVATLVATLEVKIPTRPKVKFKP